MDRDLVRHLQNYHSNMAMIDAIRAFFGMDPIKMCVDLRRGARDRAHNAQSKRRRRRRRS